MIPRLAYKPQIKRQIMNRANLKPQNFARLHQVMHVRQRVLPVHETQPPRVQRLEHRRPLPVPHVNHPLRREQHPVAPVPRRHHAIKHIHPPLDSLQDIQHHHQVDGQLLRHIWLDGVDIDRAPLSLRQLVHNPLFRGDRVCLPVQAGQDASPGKQAGPDRADDGGREHASPDRG